MQQKIPDFLNLPSLPRTAFRHAPLSLVLCQIRFPNRLGFGGDTTVASFQRAVEGEYPFVDEATDFQIQVGGLSAALSSPPVQSQSKWVFSDESDDWKLILASSFLSLETRQYRDFESFQERLSFALSALVEHIQPNRCTRVGLRYINEIRNADCNWEGVVRENLLGPLSVAEISSRAISSRQEIFLRFDGRSHASVRHGLFPEGTTVDPPPTDADLSTPFYLIDIDAYGEFSKGKSIPLTVASVSELVDQYHDVVSAFFRWSITDKYASSLAGRDA
ncbi:hypothetical protein BH23CHL2_BH23CHL2_26030 [soil metagenome]